MCGLCWLKTLVILLAIKFKAVVLLRSALSGLAIVKLTTPLLQVISEIGRYVYSFVAGLAAFRIGIIRGTFHISGIDHWRIESSRIQARYSNEIGDEFLELHPRDSVWAKKFHFGFYICPFILYILYTCWNVLRISFKIHSEGNSTIKSYIFHTSRFDTLYFLTFLLYYFLALKN